MTSRALNDLRLARLRLQVPIPDSLPKLLQDGIDACTLIVTDRDRFPELGSGRGQARFQFSGSMRERDLRRLEACAKVLMCVLLHLDLVRQRMGKPRRDGSCDALWIARPRYRDGRDRLYVDRFQQATIEKETGLGRTALYCALADVRDAGFINIHQPVKRYETRDGRVRFRGFPSVITVNMLLWQRLGFDPEDVKEQGKLANQREKQADPVILDVRFVRERRRIMRNMRALAAKSSRLNPNFEKTAAERLERLRRLETERKRE